MAIASKTFAARHHGGWLVVRAGKRYPDQHPVVTEHPAMFVLEGGEVVESASAAPGEKRRRGRPPRDAG